MADLGTPEKASIWSYLLIELLKELGIVRLCGDDEVELDPAFLRDVAHNVESVPEGLLSAKDDKVREVLRWAAIPTLIQRCSELTGDGMHVDAIFATSEMLMTMLSIRDTAGSGDV